MKTEQGLEWCEHLNELMKGEKTNLQDRDLISIKITTGSNRFPPSSILTNRLEINSVQVMRPTLQVGAVSLFFCENIQDVLGGEIHFRQDASQRI